MNRHLEEGDDDDDSDDDDDGEEEEEDSDDDDDESEEEEEEEDRMDTSAGSTPFKKKAENGSKKDKAKAKENKEVSGVSHIILFYYLDMLGEKNILLPIYIKA